MVYYRESGDAPDAPPRVLPDKIARGELGARTGKGFYTYPNPAFQTPGWLKRDEDRRAIARMTAQLTAARLKTRKWSLTVAK